MPDADDVLMRAKEHLESAYTYEEKADFTAALLECDSALELFDLLLTSDAPTSSEALPILGEVHYLRGEILEQTGRLSEAAQAYETALTFAFDLEEARDNW